MGACPRTPPRVIVDFYSVSNFALFGVPLPKETACAKVWGALPEKISGHVSQANNIEANYQCFHRFTGIVIGFEGRVLQIWQDKVTVMLFGI